MTKPSSGTYRKPFWLAVGGTIIPIALGLIAALLSQRPQCADNVTQAQIDSGSCIIGADMSLLWVFLALPVVLFAIIAAALWAGMLWYRQGQRRRLH